LFGASITLEITNLKREDVQQCTFLLHLLKAAKYDISGGDIGDIHRAYQWAQELSKALADGWNLENVPKVEKQPDGPRNVKIKNPPAKVD